MYAGGIYEVSTLDKYEYKLRLEEIKTLNRKGRFQEAAQVADTVDWKKVRNVSTLGIISDVYKVNRRFEDAKEILLLAKEQSPQNRRILYSLCDLTVKMGQVVEAVEYYKEYVQMAPNDSSKYILLYKIYEAQDISLDERIAVLKEYKKREYNEKWAYELASLYHRCGYATECVEECDQLILWFGEGKYVMKAMELKRRYVPLSPAQQQAYDRMFGRRPEQEEEKPVVKAERQTAAAPVREEAPQEEEIDIQVKPMDMGQYNTMNLQAALAESMREVMEPETEQDSAQFAGYGQQEDLSDGAVYGRRSDLSGGAAYGQQEDLTDGAVYGRRSDLSGGVAYGQQADLTDGAVYGQQAGVIDRAAYVQQPDAAGSMFYEEQAEQPAVVQSGWSSASQAEDYDVYPEAGMHQMRTAGQEELQQSAYGGDNAEYQDDVSKVMRDSAEWDVQATGQLAVEETAAETPLKKAAEQKTGRSAAFVQPAKEETGMQQATTEERPVERQITGQMNIEDVLAEWEKLKKKNEEKRKQETRQWMLQQTGSLFDDFDQMSKDGVLEKLQREEALPMEPVQRSRREDIEKLPEEEELEEIEEIELAPQEAPVQAAVMPKPANASARAVMAAQGVMAEFPVKEAQPDAGKGQDPVWTGEQAAVDRKNEDISGMSDQQAKENVQGAETQLSEAEQKRLAIEALMREAEEKQRKAQALLMELEKERLAMLEQVAGMDQPAGRPQPAEQSVTVQAQQEVASGQSPQKQPAAQPLQQAEMAEAQAEIRRAGQTGAGQQSGAQQEAENAAENTDGVKAAGTAGITGNTGSTESANAAGIAENTGSAGAAAAAESTGNTGGAEAMGNAGSAGVTEGAAVSGNTEALNERIREQQLDEHERNMTQEERELFASFVPTKKAMRQLVKALDALSLSAFTGNMIITGAPGSDMMKLAKSVIKIMRVSDRNFSGKLARISGDVLNTRNADSIVTKIPNGALIIEKGGKLSDEGAANLVKALNQEQTGIIVFLLDSKRAMASLMDRSPQLASCFTARFDIAALDTGTLVKYGCQYAYNMEYSIDELGRLALHTRIEDMQTRDHAVTVEEVREIIDEAIDHAERFSIRHFLDILFRRRYDEDDMIILRERDFI